MQIIKIKHSGETWVETSPFNAQGFFLEFTEEEEESPSDLSQEEEPKKPVQPVEQDVSSASSSDVSVGGEELNQPAESQRAKGSKTPPPEEEKGESAEVAVATRKVKMARRRVVLNVPSDDREGGEEGEGGVRRRKQPERSKTMSCGAPSSAAIALRRQSLVMLQQGKTGEKGSRKFRAALRRDSIYEGHPGWESIRKLSVVVG